MNESEDVWVHMTGCFPLCNHMTLWSDSDSDDGMEGGTAEQLGASLANASPELKKCVASCKHIAETARQKNNFQNVSSYIHTFIYDILAGGNISLRSLTSVFNAGEWGVVPGCPGDRQSLLHRHDAGVFHRHHWDLPDGPLQPASLLTFPGRSKEVSPSIEQHLWYDWEWNVSSDKSRDFLALPKVKKSDNMCQWTFTNDRERRRYNRCVFSAHLSDACVDRHRGEVAHNKGSRAPRHNGVDAALDPWWCPLVSVVSFCLRFKKVQFIVVFVFSCWQCLLRFAFSGSHMSVDHTCGR